MSIPVSGNVHHVHCTSNADLAYSKKNASLESGFVGDETWIFHEHSGEYQPPQEIRLLNSIAL